MTAIIRHVEDSFEYLNWITIIKRATCEAFCVGGAILLSLITNTP